MTADISWRQQRPGKKLNINGGADYLSECSKVTGTKYGTLQIASPEQSSFYQAGWRCFLIGGENEFLRWIKVGHQRRTYNTAQGGRYWCDDEIILQEYQTAKRSREEVYYIFFQADEAEALKQLSFWQFQFKPLQVLSRYKPLFLGCGVFFAAALWGKIHG